MDTTIIEVVLGLVLIYAVLAALVMKIQELLAGSVLHYRAGTAHDLLTEATGRDPKLKEQLLANPLIFALFQGDTAQKRWGWTDVGPSAIPPPLFARALLIEMHAQAKGSEPGEHPSARHASPSAFIAADAPAGAAAATGAWGSLRALLPGRERNWTDFENAIAGWFVDIGDRSEGWFKRRATKWTLLVSLACAALLNVDSAHIARTLSADPQLRMGLADLAERVEAQRQAAQAAGAADPPAAAAASLAERPQVQVSARMTDAIAQLTNAFVQDKAVGLFRANLIDVKGNCELAELNKKAKENSAEARLANNKLSDSDSWVQILPIVLANVEMAQVERSTAGQTYEQAFRCIAHISAWVKSAGTASNSPDVRKSMQDAAHALESVKSGLLRLIEQQSATLSLRRSFLAEPEHFRACASDGAKTRGEFDACLRRELDLSFRLPLLHGGQNSRLQFCRAVVGAPAQETARVPPEVLAQARAASATVQVVVVRDETRTSVGDAMLRELGWVGRVCDERFAGDARLGLPALSLAPSTDTGIWSWLAGILVTAIFVSLGAPFWFDTLSKVVKLRAAGRMRDEADDALRGRGTLPLPAAPSSNSGAAAAPATGMAGPGTGPFADARNAFEDKLVGADVSRFQQNAGVPVTGRLDGPTRTKIKELSAQFGTPTEELSPLLFEAVVGRSATHAAPIDIGARVQRGSVNERMQPLAKALMRALAFDVPPRIGADVTTFNDDVRALAVLYRFKKDPGRALEAREVFTRAARNPRALDELDEALIDDILRNTTIYARETAGWLDWAIGELGQVEVNSTRRRDSNPRICAYLDKAVAGSGDGGDHTPWCGAFVSWVLLQHADTLAAADPMQARLQPTQDPLRAANWLTWGTIGRGGGATEAAAMVDAQPGDVVLFKPDPNVPDNSGHVAFFVAAGTSTVWVLGGNQTQGSRVSVQEFAANSIRAVRAA